MDQLQVPVVSDGVRKGEESLPVAPLAGGAFRLLASPGFVEGLAAGDEFALDEAAALGYRVLRRGGNLCVWFHLAHAVTEHDPAAADLRATAESLGGRLDGGWSSMLVLTVPLAAGFDAVAGAMDAATRRHPGSQWFYGNVYDPADGRTPLDWWR